MGNHRGHSGTSLGGSVVRTRRRKQQKNSSPCPSCGAGKNEPCFESGPRGLRNLSRTHRSAATEASAETSKTPARPRRATVRSAKQAYQVADALGPIIPVRPTRLRVDRSPRLGPGQVYVMRTGTVYHPAWCSTVADKWDNDPEGLFLIEISTAGPRWECLSCENPLTD